LDGEDLSIFRDAAVRLFDVSVAEYEGRAATNEIIQELIPRAL
jgi:hypothetical protein